MKNAIRFIILLFILLWIGRTLWDTHFEYFPYLRTSQILQATHEETAHFQDTIDFADYTELAISALFAISVSSGIGIAGIYFANRRNDKHSLVKYINENRKRFCRIIKIFCIFFFVASLAPPFYLLAIQNAIFLKSLKTNTELR